MPEEGSDHKARRFDQAKFQGWAGAKLDTICNSIQKIEGNDKDQWRSISVLEKATERHSTNWSWLRRIIMWAVSPGVGVAVVTKLFGLW